MSNEATVQKLVEVRSQNLEIGFPWILLIHVKVLEGEIIHIIDLARIEECWILKDTLARHHSVTACEFHGILYVIEIADASIENDWNFQSFFYFLYNLVMSRSYCLFVVLSSSAVDCQERGSSLLYLFCQIEGIRLIWKAPDLAGHWDFKVLLQHFDHADN